MTTRNIKTLEKRITKLQQKMWDAQDKLQEAQNRLWFLKAEELKKAKK